MQESLLTRHGTLPSTAADGGRYDPSWSVEADDDDEEEDNTHSVRDKRVYSRLF